MVEVGPHITPNHAGACANHPLTGTGRTSQDARKRGAASDPVASIGDKVQCNGVLAEVNWERPNCGTTEEWL